MEIYEYFTCSSKEQKHWKSEISKADWKAAKFLFKLLNQNSLKEHIGEDAKLFLLADGKKLVSFCTLAKRDEIEAPELAPWIGFVFTFPEYRKNRYAGRLISHAISVAKEKGAEAVYISTNETGLYEKYGFNFYGIMNDIWGGTSRVYKYTI